MTRKSESRFKAFTLAELMVVMVIVLILVGILLPAIGNARKKTRDIATRNQLQAISNANEQYKISFGEYAGYLSEGNLPNDFTSNENLLVSLIGRVQNSASPGTTEQIGTTGFYVNKDAVGAGPMSSGGQTYGAFYSPKPDEIATINGTKNTDNGIPEFVDASYGLPLLYFRARAGWTKPVTSTFAGGGAFQLSPVANYVESAGLRNQNYASRSFTQATSLLNTAATGGGSSAVDNLAWLTINTKISNTATGSAPPWNNGTDDVPLGGFVLMASGRDYIYINREQYGNGDASITTEAEATDSKRDDIIVKGGTAP